MYLCLPEILSPRSNSPQKFCNSWNVLAVCSISKWFSNCFSLSVSLQTSECAVFGLFGSVSLFFVSLVSLFLLLLFFVEGFWFDIKGVKENVRKSWSGHVSWAHVQLTSLTLMFSGETTRTWWICMVPGTVFRVFACNWSSTASISASETVYNLMDVLFDTTLIKSSLLLISAPSTTLRSAVRFKVPPTPSGTPFPWPASK